MIGNSKGKIGWFTECLRRQTFSGMSKAGEAPEDGKVVVRLSRILFPHICTRTLSHKAPADR